MMKKQKEIVNMLHEKTMDTQKISYSAPTVHYVPQSNIEEFNREMKKGTWAVPIGCC